MTEWTYERLIEAIGAEGIPPEGLARALTEEPEGETARRYQVVRAMFSRLADARFPEPDERSRREARATPAVSGTFALRNLLGRLVPPSRGAAVPALRGSRGEGRWLFEAGSFEVDVMRSPEGGLVGQVLHVSGEASSMETCLLFGEAGQKLADVSGEGEFSFESVDAGSYTLLLEGGSDRLVLPDLDIPRAHPG